MARELFDGEELMSPDPDNWPSEAAVPWQLHKYIKRNPSGPGWIVPYREQ